MVGGKKRNNANGLENIIRQTWLLILLQIFQINLRISVKLSISGI